MVCALAIPVALQSVLQSSFSIIDQVMIGQLGEVPIAGVGFAGKFTSIYNVVISAVSTVAGIMISQYLGQKNQSSVQRSFWVNLLFCLGIGMIFMLLGIFCPQKIIRFYTEDPAVRQIAARYLQIVSLSSLPAAGTLMLSTLFRCAERPKAPMYASIVAAVMNTVLNYLLIFGKFGFPAWGAVGAAIATFVSQVANFLVVLLIYLYRRPIPFAEESSKTETKTIFPWQQYAFMLLPILISEVAWSFGENAYAAIYGHMSTAESSAMNLINPVQGLVIGGLCGLSQAAGVIVGKQLGNHAYEEAYDSSKKLLWYGAVGSVILSLVVVWIAPVYVRIYQVEDHVKTLTCQILYAYALVAPFKVLNMILGGGIIRSGGKTKYVMVIDLIGTWCFGVPLGLLGANVLHLSVAGVYFLLSLEECIRFGMSWIVFRSRKWIHSFDGGMK